MNKMDKRQRRLRRGKRRGRRTLCVSELTLFFTPVVKEKGGGGCLMWRGKLGLLFSNV